MKLKAVFLPRTSDEEDLSYFEARNDDFPIGSTFSELFLLRRGRCAMSKLIVCADLVSQRRRYARVDGSILGGY